jgi:hypothetical protein
VVHTEYIFFFFFINWTFRMSDNLPERVQILCHAHIICIDCTGKQNYLLSNILWFALKICFWAIFNVMQLILVKIKWHIKWKYVIQKFHDICLSYYFKIRKDKLYLKSACQNNKYKASSIELLNNIKWDFDRHKIWFSGFAPKSSDGHFRLGTYQEKQAPNVQYRLLFCYHYTFTQSFHSSTRIKIKENNYLVLIFIIHMPTNSKFT